MTSEVLDEHERRIAELEDQVATLSRAVADLAGPELADEYVAAHARWAASMSAGGAAT